MLTATSGGIAAGVIGQVHHHAPPRRAAAWPHQVGAVPPQAAHFQDREESAELTAALAGGGTAVLGQEGRVTVVGLGGVGKSQLAAQYARGAMRSGEVDVLVWTTATTRSAVIDTYARAAAELIGPAAPEDPEHAAAAFTAWLEAKAGRPNCRWLVVLDDLTDPDDLTGLWPPASPVGRTLVTTRRQDPALLTGRRLVTVGVFSPDEARAYLTDVLDRHPAGELDALAADLGCLPLALAQAAAYIAELADTGITPAAYRSLLTDRTTALRDAAPDRLPDGQALTVAATWSLSIEHADTMRPAGLARPMLHLASFLDPNGIPDAVLTGGPALGYLARCRGGGAAEERRGLLARFRRRSRTPSATEAEARRALSALRRLSLVEHSPDRPATAVRVHQLVQRAVRDTLANEQRDRLARTAADALLAAWPDVERDTPSSPPCAPTPPCSPNSRGKRCTDRMPTRCCTWPATVWAKPATSTRPVTTSTASPRSRPATSDLITRTPSSHGAASPIGAGKPGTWPARSPRSPNCCRTSYGCWEPTTPTPLPSGAISPTGKARWGTWRVRSPRSPNCWPTWYGRWARTTPIP
ncbi:NB-ARC domain-containing protein [Kitasatospora sp. NPDC058162]|uniref:DUF7779 domain-containing protein n=1 Tax=Kitasatospora sp. NPDC058162 TaxID=3346362 RepID=UPI0036D7813C